MDQASAQTEKITSYKTSRTRRSRVDGKLHSDDSNNDEEYATSGFYVREKTTEKRPESTNTTSLETDKECKENGIAPQANSPKSPAQNGDDSKDGESSRDSKKHDSTKKNSGIDQQNQKEDTTKEDIESENNDTKDSIKGDEKQPESKEENSKDNAENCKDSEKIDDSSGSKDTVKEEKIEEKEPKTTKKKVKEDNLEKAEEEKKDLEKQNESKEEKSIESKNNKEKKESKSDDAKEVTVENKTVAEKIEENVDSSKEIIDEKSKETNKDNKDDQDEKDTEKTSEASILKEHLEKQASGNSEENMDTEMDMDEDFDPSLLCPDISMDVDEAPVNTESQLEDGSTSPLPYEATFSTLVDEITGAEVQVDLTPEEMELRSKMYGPNNPVQATKVHCTACNIHLGSALTGANNRFVHPLLKVLICKNCYHFYTSGEFEKDEDGSELYCRWCGQGGQVLCCSSCEFVFCKRCIRNNFGPRKFKEIRDSDDWNCFRCDRNQLSNLRASCAEFMEYYRTELARAQALSGTKPELMTTDYTSCCKSGGDKKDENKTTVAQKNARRKRKDEDDPDYHPIVDPEGEPPKKKFGSSIPSGSPGYTVIPPSIRPLMPKPIAGQVVRPLVSQQGQKAQNQGQVFKVGNTTFRARAPSNGQGYTVQRPTVSQGPKSSSPGYITIPPSAAPKNNSPGYITIPPSAAPKTTSPGYIKIMPQQRMQSPRPTGTYTVVSGTNNGKPTFTTVRPKQPATLPTMKHEWFEKTVRAAARVNSNLSYTLTQLNRQQSQANSVEALAMVHNKLQEVLSTSINSLIQIRKNLRTEFISGIKNIKFPAKPASISPNSAPIVVKDDDDVIFVNSPSILPPPPPLVLSPSVSMTKNTPIQNTSDPFANPKPSTSGVPPKSAGMPGKGGFLKVRSFTSLQSVPSECITIPDDPPASSDVKIIEEEDPLKITDEDTPKDDKEDLPKPEVVSTFDEFMVYNTKDEPTPAIKKMIGAVVMVKKSRVVDEIIRAQGLLGKKGKEDEKNKKENESNEKDSEKATVENNMEKETSNMKENNSDTKEEDSDSKEVEDGNEITEKKGENEIKDKDSNEKIKEKGASKEDDKNKEKTS